MALDTDDRNDNPADDDRDRTADAGKGGKGSDKSGAPDSHGEEIERLRAALKKANHDAASNRRKLDEIERAEKERADATLPEIDRLRKQVAARDAEAADSAKALENLRTENRRMRLHAEIRRDYADKVMDVELLMNSIPLDAIEEDETTGKFRGIDRAVEAAIKRHPLLVAQMPRGGTPSAGMGGGSPPRRLLVGGNGGVQRETEAELYARKRANGSGGF